MKRSYWLFLVVFASCWKEEIPISKVDRQGLQTQRIVMGSAYNNVVWFDFGTGSVVQQRNKYEWDIEVEKKGERVIVRLNGAAFPSAARTDYTDLSDIPGPGGYSFKADEQSGLEDSLAIGKWAMEGKAWLLDRGFDDSGLPRGVYALQLDALSTPGQLILRYRHLPDGAARDMIIPVGDREQGIGISLENNSFFDLVPTQNWDIVFTQYVHLFYEPEYTPYLVNGVLLNVFDQSIGSKVGLPFESVNGDNALLNEFSEHQDVIGYTWKTYDFDSGLYTVDSETTYLIRDQDGRVYKMRFLDFYDDSGERGSPLFTFEEL